MEQRIFHGNVDPADVADSLLAEFDRGNLRAQRVGQADHVAVQIGTRPGAPSGGRTALTVSIDRIPDGVLINLGQQEWLGTAASLGQTTMAAIMNPWNLLNRLDDIAQDMENLQLSSRVWQLIDHVAQARGASQQLSERLSRTTCEYCGVANSVGEAACIACGAPMGNAQPVACPYCGFVLLHAETKCTNCGQLLPAGLVSP